MRACSTGMMRALVPREYGRGERPWCGHRRGAADRGAAAPASVLLSVQGGAGGQCGSAAGGRSTAPATTAEQQTRGHGGRSCSWTHALSRTRGCKNSRARPRHGYGRTWDGGGGWAEGNKRAAGWAMSDIAGSDKTPRDCGWRRSGLGKADPGSLWASPPGPPASGLALLLRPRSTKCPRSLSPGLRARSRSWG
jgi:hypothetical protein